MRFIAQTPATTNAMPITTQAIISCHDIVKFKMQNSEFKINNKNYINSCAMLYVAKAQSHAMAVLYMAEPMAHFQPLSEPMAVIVPMQGI